MLYSVVGTLANRVMLDSPSICSIACRTASYRDCNLIFGWTSCVSAKANVGESKIRSAKAVPHGCSAIWDTGESRHTGQRRKTSSGSVPTSGKDYVTSIIAGAQRYYQKVQPTPFNMSAFDPIAKLWCILTHMPYGRG